MIVDTMTPVGGLAICPNCLLKLPFVLPVEPLYDIKLAAQLIPMAYDALRQYLNNHRHEFLRRYRKDRSRRIHRMLTASEIRAIRSRILIFKGADKKRREMTPEGN